MRDLGCRVSGTVFRKALRSFCSLWLCSLSCFAAVAWAADPGKLVEKDGKYVFVESMDPATKLLLERAVKQGTITQEEYDNILKESQERQYLLQPSFKAWYDRCNASAPA